MEIKILTPLSFFMQNRCENIISNYYLIIIKVASFKIKPPTALGSTKLIQLARKDVEINSHRKRRKELEDRIRSLQEKVVESCTESAELRDKLAAEKRDSSPASKEYLRNLGIKINFKFRFTKVININPIFPTFFLE